MHRRDFIRTLGLSAAGFFLSGCTGKAASSSKMIDLLNKEDDDESKAGNLSVLNPAKFGKLELKNRIWRSATWTAQSPDGNLNNSILKTYLELAQGGVGAIITGFTSMHPLDTGIHRVVRFTDDSDLANHKKITEMVHKEKVPIFLQGAISDLDYTSSPIKGSSHGLINSLTSNQIKNIIESYGDCARRAEIAGYDGIQIHAAHFFFLSRFISPSFNRRTDDYGGSVERRAKILTDIISEVKSKTNGDFLTLIKINSEDGTSDGLTVKDFIDTCMILEKAGIDAIEVSSNGTSVPDIRPMKNEACFLEAARLLKKETGIPIILVGGHRSLSNMNSILNKDGIDFYSMSRPLIREPDLINRWKSGNITPSKCISCNGCYRTEAHKCILEA